MVFLVCFCFIGMVLSQNLVGAQDTQLLLYESVFVNQGSNSFYEYTVFGDDKSNIVVNITDQNVTNYNLRFDNAAPVFFVVAYYKFIIAKEVDRIDPSYVLNYWIIEINRTQTGFNLISFAVSGFVDNQGYNWGNAYVLTQIIEYNQIDNFLYVVLEDSGDANIYGINMSNPGGKLISINWFLKNPDNPQQIDGGNSRVLDISNYYQFYIDTRPVRTNDNPNYITYNNSNPTHYNIVNVADLTTRTIYPNAPQKVFNLLGSYFQYTSFKQDQMRMTAFLYHGYGDQPIQYEINLISNSSIKTFSDQATFFIAISDQDIYLTTVQWNQTTQNYNVNNYLYSTTFKIDPQHLSNTLTTLSNFKQTLWIAYNDHKLYIYTYTNFYVYGAQASFPQLYSNSFSGSKPPTILTTDLVDQMFEQIKTYQNKK